MKNNGPKMVSFESLEKKANDCQIELINELPLIGGHVGIIHLKTGKREIVWCKGATEETYNRLKAK